MFLTIELLKDQHGHKRSSVLPRSDIVQDLSIFVSSLGWVARPDEANYNICRDVQRMLKHKLTILLDDSPSVPTSSILSHDPPPTSLVYDHEDQSHLFDDLSFDISGMPD